jgi:hypothetical protein
MYSKFCTLHVAYTGVLSTKKNNFRDAIPMPFAPYNPRIKYSLASRIYTSQSSSPAPWILLTQTN